MAAKEIIDQSEDVAKLTKALQNERGERKAVEASLKTAKDRIAEMSALGIAPDAMHVSEYIANATKAGVAHETNELQQKVATLESELVAAKTAATDMGVKLVTRSIAEEVRNCAREAHILPTAVNDLISLGNLELKMVDGKVVNAEGIDVATWIDNRKATAPYLWPVSRGSGTRGSQGNDIGLAPTGPNPWSKETWNMTQQGNLVKSDPAAAERMRASAVQ